MQNKKNMKRISLMFSTIAIFALVFTSSCNEENETYSTTPEVSTFAVEEITQTTAISGGNVGLDGGAAITQRGICYGTSPNPTIADSYTTNGNGMGSFTSNLSGLSPNTTYYVRAYATNSAGTGYGFELSFTTDSPGEVGIVSSPGQGVTFDGYSYSTVVLGNGQEWMAENLRTVRYANGDLIPNSVPDGVWASQGQGWAHYQNNSQFDQLYGKLYKWQVVGDSRSICPAGWHVPSQEEWTLLAEYMGEEISAGGKLKSTDLWENNWTGGEGNGTNESGFSGLPGGRRGYDGGFSGMSSIGVWWSSSQSFSGYTDLGAYAFTLVGNADSYNLTVHQKKEGYSVRCVKD